MIAIHISVVAAFLDSGRRKAGTPFEIASTPVSATAPEEKPFRMMKMVRLPPNSFCAGERLGSRTAPCPDAGRSSRRARSRRAA